MSKVFNGKRLLSVFIAFVMILTVFNFSFVNVANGAVTEIPGAVLFNVSGGVIAGGGNLINVLAAPAIPADPLNPPDLVITLTKTADQTVAVSGTGSGDVTVVDDPVSPTYTISGANAKANTYVLTFAVSGGAAVSPITYLVTVVPNTNVIFGRITDNKFNPVYINGYGVQGASSDM